MANPLIGRCMIEVFIAEDKGAIRFDLDTGLNVIARCDADCCSYTWIEHVENSEALFGATVLSVEDVDMPDAVDPHPEEHDQVAFYGCKITTDKGTMLIDYRNDSNGYYGGSLIWPEDSFYGGVHNQNVSKENWLPLTDL